MIEESKYNEYELEYPRPWDIPIDIWWDKSENANIRRGQWVIDNCVDVPLEEIRYELVLQPEEIKQLDLSSRSHAEEQAE